jgi:hypothetical protein
MTPPDQLSPGSFPGPAAPLSAVPFMPISLLDEASGIVGNEACPKLFSLRSLKAHLRHAQWAGAVEIGFEIPSVQLLENQTGRLRYLGFRTIRDYLAECESLAWNLGGAPLFPSLEIQHPSSPELLQQLRKLETPVSVPFPAFRSVSPSDLQSLQIAGAYIAHGRVPLSNGHIEGLQISELDPWLEAVHSLPTLSRIDLDIGNLSHDSIHHLAECYPYLLQCCLESGVQLAVTWAGNPPKGHWILFTVPGLKIGRVHPDWLHFICQEKSEYQPLVATDFYRRQDLSEIPGRTTTRLLGQLRRYAQWQKDRGPVAPSPRYEPQHKRE